MKISTINAMLVANAAGFVAGCKQAQHASEEFAGHSEGISHRLEHIVEALGLAEVGAKLAEFVHASIEANEAARHQAEILGISSQKYQELAYAAKLTNTSIDTVSSAMVKLSAGLGGIDVESGTAAQALSRLGLNATELARLPVDEKIDKIADAMKGIEGHDDKVNIARNLFGKSGAELLPLLEKGSEGIHTMSDEAIRLGVALSETDSAKVEAAGVAMKRVGSLVEGLGNTITVSLAPYIEGFADALLDAGVDGTSMSSTITDGVELVAEGIAEASGTIDLFEGAWYALKGTVLIVAAAMIEHVDLIGGTVTKLLNLIPGVSVQWESLGDVAEGMAEQAKEAFGQAGDKFSDMASGKRAESVSAFFDNVKSHAAESAAASEEAAKHVGHVSEEAAQGAAKIQDQIEALKKSVADFGKSDTDKLASDLKNKGASPEQIAEATAAQAELDRLKEKAKAHDDATAAAKNYYEATRTPAEKAAAEIEKINKLVSDGALDAETAQRAIDKANKDASLPDDKDKNKKDDAPGAAKLLQAGSAEAASFLSSLQRQGQADDGQKAVAKNTEQSAKYLKIVADKLSSTDDGTVLDIA